MPNTPHPLRLADRLVDRAHHLATPSVRGELEGALSALPLVQECAVLMRAAGGQERFFAYVVTRGAISRQKLDEQLRQALPAARLPDHYAFVTRLPYTDSGAVDEAALSKIPLIDESVAEDVETALTRDLNLDAAVMLDPRAAGSQWIHERQLLPPSLWAMGSMGSVVSAEPARLSLDLAGMPALPLAGELEFTEAPPASMPPAEVEGGPLSIRDSTPRTLPDALRSAATRFDDPRITFLGYGQSVRQETFSALLSEARRIHGGLRAHGLASGQLVVLQLERPEDILPAFWACLIGGLVPVITAMPPSYTTETNELERLCQVVKLLETPVVLTANGNAEISPLLARTGLSPERAVALDDLRRSHAIADALDLDPDAPAFLTLTSGSTGTPKAIMLSHTNVLARARGTNRLCSHVESDRILNWLPFDHIGSISDWHLRCVVLGCHMVYCTKDYVLGDPLNWLRLIDRHRITHSWAPNFAYALVNDAVKKSSETWDLSCLVSLLTAGEAVSSSTVREFLDSLGAQGLARTVVRPAFGMAELGSGVTYYRPTAVDPVRVRHVQRASLDGKLAAASPEDAGAIGFTSLGPVIPSARMRIVDEQDRVLPEGTVGRLQIAGAPVCLGYYRNPDANKEVFAGGGWFNTGDRGFVHAGELYLTGRDKETLVVNGANYHSGEIESAVSAVPGVRVSFTAACAVRDNEAERLAVFFCTDVGDTELRALLTEIQSVISSKIGIKADYLLPVTPGSIPKTAIGKIQRKQLTRRFELGEFEDVIRHVDVLLQNERAVPDWFLAPAFRAKALIVRRGAAPTRVLIVEDAHGFGQRVGRLLLAEDIAVTFVPHGAPIPPPIGKTTDVLDFTDYGPAPDPDGDAPETDAASWLLRRTAQISRMAEKIALASGAAPGKKPVYRVIASHAQAARRGDIVDVLRAALPAALMTLTLESGGGGMEGAHLDVPFEPAEADTLARLVAAECAARSRDAEVALRNQVRLVRSFKKVSWGPAESRAPRLQRGGLYVVTGGLGGIGAELSRYLLDHWSARLLLIGRARTDGPGADPARGAVLTELERRGTVRYEAVDVTDAFAMRAAIERGQMRLGLQVSGAFHLASGYEESSLAAATRESLDTVLAPKVLGAAALHHALAGTKAFVVCFSSLAGIEGGANLGAYAMANRMVDAVSQEQRARGRRSYSVSWSVWKGLGVGAGAAPAGVLRSKGYHTINVRKGMASLVAILGLEPGHFVVGADPEHVTFASRVEGTATSTESIVAGLVPTGELAELTAPSLSLSCARVDVLGNAIPIQFRPIPAASLGPDGAIDRGALLAALRGDRTATRVAPVTPLQKQLAEVWRRLLDLDEVGINESFFDIGGSSLLAVRLFGHLEQAFGVALPLATLFRAPTIEALAAVIDVDRATENPNSVRLLSPGGGNGKMTLHLLPDLDGETEAFRALAQHLGSAVRVYALAPHAEGVFPAVHTRIEDMAAHYAARIRQMQPRGPYALGGLGVGGVLAHAVACRLQTASEAVPLVALFDAVDAAQPIGNTHASGVFPKVEAGFAERLRAGSARLSASWTKSGVDYARVKLLRRYLQRGERPPFFLEHIPFEAVYRIAAAEYAPPRFAGNLVLFRAGAAGTLDPADLPAREGCHDRAFGWTARASAGVQVIDVSGGHRGMLCEPHVAALSQYVMRELEDALRGGRPTERSA